ncbi:ArsA family ATPase [Nocardia stercoris]|uniref:ArsA family ATPase n=1 Tax=Nocardia stercoris TaxID=2483361 RepID=A0A3M2KTX6_9NOCA|nr:ArsA family ATPase [Nocardia stercoris]RMI29102.1 ArsA family ATPase [Nocardia stercoris]
MGKGGVGKTTLACATAMAHARAGQRVLVASLDQAHSLGDALGTAFPHGGGVSTVTSDLDVVEVDSLALLEERFRGVAGALAGAGHDHGFDPGALDPAELTGLPGVQELLMLVEIAGFARRGSWDVIVLDCPPSADMLRIVTAPETLLGYLDRIWPAPVRSRSLVGGDLRRAVLAVVVDRIAEAVGEVRDLLADHRRTGVRLVTGAERVAVAESARVRSAAALLGLRLDEVVVNKVLPPLPSAGGPQHPAAQWYSSRRAEQLAVIAELRRRCAGVPVTIAHHSGPEPVGLDCLAALSHAVGTRAPAGSGDADPMMLGIDADDASGAADAGHPQVRLESGTGLASVFTMRLDLPVVDPSTLRLGRVEDDLIVGADGVRRRLRLAPELRQCTVDAAELTGDQLVLRFRPDPQVWAQ